MLSSGLPAAKFPMAQTSSYVTAPDQSKAVLQIRAMRRLSAVSYNKSVVVSEVTEQYCSFASVCVAYSSIGIFRCDFFHVNFLQQSHSEISFLLGTCASLYCSHAKQIKEDLDDIE